MYVKECKYGNGKIKYRSNSKIIKGYYVSYGLQEAWYSNGQLRYKLNCLYNQKHGLQEYWYLTGQKEYEENYIIVGPEDEHGEKHGLQKYYTNDKQINEYYKYGTKITKEEYEQYLNSIQKGILNILQIGKNTLDTIIKRYLN